MKNKQIRIFLSIIIIIIELFALLLYVRDSKIINYTKVKDENLFMMRLQDHTDGYQLKDAEEKNFCLFEVVDEDEKPIEKSTIQLYRDGDVIATLTTNADGIAAISGLEAKKYTFKQTKSKKDVALNEDLTEVNLNKEQCSFIIKNGKDETSITKKEDSNLINLLSDEEKDLLKTTKSVGMDSYIFLIEPLRGSQLTLYSRHDEENKKMNYYLLIDDAIIKKIDIHWQEKPSNQKLVDENGKKTDHFSQSEFALVYEKEMRDAPVTMTIVFEKDGKTYEIKKDFILGKELQEQGTAVIKNNTDSKISFTLRLESTHDKSEDSFSMRSEIEEKGTYHVTELKSGVYYLTIDRDENSSSKYFVVEGERLTEVEITE